MDDPTTAGAEAVSAPESAEAAEAAGTAPLIPPPRIPPEGAGEAPFGYTLEGQPKKSRAGRPRKGATGTAPPKRTRPSSSRPRAAASSGPDYRRGVLGLFQLPAGALMAAGMVRPELALDGFTLAMHAPAVAEAVNDLARENPGVAAMLDRVLQVGPYGALIAAVVPMAVQVMVNHGMLPAGFMGSMSADQLRALAEQQAPQAAAA